MLTQSKGLLSLLSMASKINTKNQKDKLFEEEFFPIADDLYNFAYHLTYEEESAHDLVQETFMKAYRFIDSYEKGTNAKAWLFRILKNGFINEYRKKSKQPTRADFEDVINYHDSEEAKANDVSVDFRQDVFQGIIGDEVTKAINELPADFRLVILLCDIEGFTYEEIAKIVDIPIGTVRSRLHRARNLLKEKLKGYAKNLGYN